MYMAMTRFHISVGQELLFESAWRRRTSYLNNMEGYRGLYLLRGETEENSTLYISHFIWNNKANFDTWTKSEEFIKAHIQFGDIGGLFVKKPIFEGLETVLQERVDRGQKQ